MGPAEIERKMKIIAPIHSISTRNRAFQKNIKKVKNIIMASFQAKTAQERLRMWEKKKFSFWSIPTRPGIGILEK